MGTQLVRDFPIDDWLIKKGLVPGLEAAVLNLIQALIGEPLKYCNGDCAERGYREGTRWLHLYLLPEDVCNAVELLIDKMCKPYKERIDDERTERDQE